MEIELSELIILGILMLVCFLFGILGIILEASRRLSRTASWSEGYPHGPYISTVDTVTNTT